MLTDDSFERKQEKLTEAVKYIAMKITPEIIADTPGLRPPATPVQATPSETTSTPATPSIEDLQPPESITETPLSSRQLKPKFIAGPQPNTYLLGGNHNMVRQVSDYKCILREVQMRKSTATLPQKIF